MGFWTSTQAAGGVLPKTAWQPVAADVQSDASYFLDCLATGRDSDVNAAAGAHIVEVILAAYRSAASGQPVPLESSL
jgi:predicted dehydrogenase